MSWTASTDNVGVTGYLVERCQGTGCSSFAQIGTPAGTTYNDTGLTANTSYSYRVRATDAAGNLSAYSNVASATTQALIPSHRRRRANLTATASQREPDQSELDGVDGQVGVTGYLIERCQGAGCTNWARLVTVPGTTYSDTGLIPNTSYSYRVKATDAAGNFSPYSNIATATTLATIPGLVAAYSFDEGQVRRSRTYQATEIPGRSRTPPGRTQPSTATHWCSTDPDSLITNQRFSFLASDDRDDARSMGQPVQRVDDWRDVIYKGKDNYFLEATSDRVACPLAGPHLLRPV